MLVGYARVSTSDQTEDVQLEQLTVAGCEKIFSEKKSGRTAVDRPELQRALEFVREGDALVVTRLDRLARSVRDLHQIVDRLTAKGVSFQCLHQGGGIDTSRSDGKLFLTILGGFAEFEADLRHERQREGIARVRKESPEKYGGRPPTIDKERIRTLHNQGMKPPEIAAEMKIGLASVYRALPPKDG